MKVVCLAGYKLSTQLIEKKLYLRKNVYSWKTKDQLLRKLNKGKVYIQSVQEQKVLRIVGPLYAPYTQTSFEREKKEEESSWLQEFKIIEQDFWRKIHLKNST